MNEKWFFIGALIGIVIGLASGKIMFDRSGKLPTINKWKATERISDLEEENKQLRHEINTLIEQNIKLISDSTDMLK